MTLILAAVIITENSPMELLMVPSLIKLLELNDIDVNLTEKILNTINKPDFHNANLIKASGIPSSDSRSFAVYDFSETAGWEGDYNSAVKNLSEITDSVNLSETGIVSKGRIKLTRKELAEIGLYLLPFVSIGILNGGSATSYVDYQKNSLFNPLLFEKCREMFTGLSEKYRDTPKGIVPAYINPDYSEGASFIELKMRSMLLTIRKYQERINRHEIVFPFFQMTSIYNNSQIESELINYSNSPYLSYLKDKTGIDITSVLTGIQPVIPAFSHSCEGFPRKVFTCAYGKPDTILPLPGGHGQNFMILKDIYKKLYDSGKRFVYLGNVDNIGFNIDLKEVAALALSGNQAGFDFSHKTPVDVKGGILVFDESGKINCADIGPAISQCDVEEAEKQGKNILFNCATGLFNLKYLVENIDSIINNLPLRVSDQDKDAGMYSQAEQTTWEVIGELDNVLIFAVDKYKRFLASKLLLENLLISRPACCESYFRNNPDDPMNNISLNMNRGLENILINETEMIKRNGKWQPL